ncbi:hypothetical protein Tco_0434335 [Tanacetum coccineum]
MEYAPSVNQQSGFSQPDSGLIVPVFQKGDDPIDAINHMMSFFTAVVTYHYPTTNNQLRISPNPRQQATINNGRVTLQPIQGRQTSLAAGTSRTYTPGASGSNSGKQRTLKHMVRFLMRRKLASFGRSRIPELALAEIPVTGCEMKHLKTNSSEHLKERNLNASGKLRQQLVGADSFKLVLMVLTKTNPIVIPDQKCP